jgi:AAA+ ATPase superfamily predicted ATPase
MERFVDREEELARLEALYESDEAELAVVYRENKASASGLDPEGEADS